MKKVIYFFLILIIFVFLFDIKFLNYFFSKKLSNWTEHTSEVNISKLNYFKGELEINKIQIKNNKNFESKIFDTNLITINFDFKSLFSNLVLINSVVIIDPIFYFEIKVLINFIDKYNSLYSLKYKEYIIQINNQNNTKYFKFYKLFFKYK